MDIKQIAEEMAKLIREGKNKEAKEKFYARDIVSIEPNGYTVTGIDAVWKKSVDWAAQVAEVHSASVAEPLVAADHFALQMRMEISLKNGDRVVMDEIGVYAVNEGKIVSEQYFFKS